MSPGATLIESGVNGVTRDSQRQKRGVAVRRSEAAHAFHGQQGRACESCVPCMCRLDCCIFPEWQMRYVKHQWEERG